MKFYQVTILPESGFATPLKGDTLFGHFCWQAHHDPTLLDGGLEQWLTRYKKAPFAVFSSAFPFSDEDNTYILKRPEIPLPMIFPAGGKSRIEAMKENKENKSKKWMFVRGGFIDLNTAIFMTDAMAYDYIFERAGKRAVDPAEAYSRLTVHGPQQHNTINRLTGTTGTGIFAPYQQEAEWFMPGLNLVVYVLVDEAATDIERIKSGLARIGRWGFGRDASTGMGRFQVKNAVELEPVIPQQCPQNAFYTLAPAVLSPNSETFEAFFFKPFVRFGKHGGGLAVSRNPFKNPVIMADEAAVFVPRDKRSFSLPYAGQAVSNLSKVLPETVCQGYTPFLPIKMEQAK